MTALVRQIRLHADLDEVEVLDSVLQRLLAALTSDEDWHRVEGLVLSASGAETNEFDAFLCIRDRYPLADLCSVSIPMLAGWPLPGPAIKVGQHLDNAQTTAAITRLREALRDPLGEIDKEAADRLIHLDHVTMASDWHALIMRDYALARDPEYTHADGRFMLEVGYDSTSGLARAMAISEIGPDGDTVIDGTPTIHAVSLANPVRVVLSRPKDHVWRIDHPVDICEGSTINVYSNPIETLRRLQTIPTCPCCIPKT